MPDTPPSALAEYLSRPSVTAVALGAELNVSHSTVLRWAAGRVPADRVVDVSRVTGIPAAQLRPDLAAAFTHADAPPVQSVTAVEPSPTDRLACCLAQPILALLSVLAWAPVAWAGGAVLKTLGH
ncbi:helix-turn-helix domain containing protein [Roseomonas xinghualingensis]|uniref:helix-turn-helix domain containing protein n=1 Tax=Roseomonas xinghualingensis TaxID=2986475 RepID=UPI0021F1D5B8|nr:helix-turn-helix domain containing protein [Roseomonas sp. SXEYE001]MCV4207547.1 helix-turn-helix domain containing protein [Roseomonas sp. SXEYE001]